ncbi:MAG: GNAT family N-acetyltransferase [Alphaproteobacteria bacterium]
MDRVGASEWDGAAGVDASGAGNPLVSHAFLAALESSGSATSETGWAPHHLLIRDALGTLVGAAPLYLKSHSYGDYVFDWGWAEAFERAGGRYYPKLQLSVSFTPATGPRLMARPDLPADRAHAVRAFLIEALKGLATRNGISSVHITFPPQDEWRALGKAGWLERTGQQFHWENHDYADFGAFVAALSSRKRKAIAKERRAVAQSGIAVRPVLGCELTPVHWDAFFDLYTASAAEKWGQPYLTREFFQRIGQTMAERIVLVVCEHNGRMVGGALNFLGGGVLYGRNWGCEAQVKFLHFEACYYQAIEFAIRHGLARVEAGAQGPHKIQRGYLPAPTYSAHWIADPGFRRAVADYLARETQHVEREIDELSSYSPFKRGALPTLE